MKSLNISAAIVKGADPRAGGWDHDVPPDVSVLTCTYDRFGMLAECLASVRAQTHASWEHLIWDNGSTDPRVREVIDGVSEDPRIRIFRSERNIDQPARRWNDLIDRAVGQHVCFLDDDCAKDPTFFKVLLSEFAIDPDLDVVTCGFREVHEDGTIAENHANLRTDEEVWRQNTVDTGAFLIRREALERVGYFPLDIRTSEDWALARRMVACLRMRHLPDCLTSWREHGGQRLHRARALGGERDKIRILRSTWRDSIGVRIFYPEGSEDSRCLAVSIENIPWVAAGDDLAVELAPAGAGPFGPMAQALAIASEAPSVLVVHWEDPLNLAANLDRARALAVRREDVWSSTNDPGSALAYREILGERVIVCPLGDFSDVATRVRRVINSVRSRRYEAVIP